METIATLEVNLEGTVIDCFSTEVYYYVHKLCLYCTCSLCTMRLSCFMSLLFVCLLG